MRLLLRMRNRSVCDPWSGIATCTYFWGCAPSAPSLVRSAIGDALRATWPNVNVPVLVENITQPLGEQEFKNRVQYHLGEGGGAFEVRVLLCEGGVALFHPHSLGDAVFSRWLFLHVLRPQDSSEFEKSTPNRKFPYFAIAVGSLPGVLKKLLGSRVLPQLKRDIFPSVIRKSSESLAPTSSQACFYNLQLGESDLERIDLVRNSLGGGVSRSAILLAVTVASMMELGFEHENGQVLIITSLRRYSRRLDRTRGNLVTSIRLETRQALDPMYLKKRVRSFYDSRIPLLLCLFGRLARKFLRVGRGSLSPATSQSEDDGRFLMSWSDRGHLAEWENPERPLSNTRVVAAGMNTPIDRRIAFNLCWMDGGGHLAVSFDPSLVDSLRVASAMTQVRKQLVELSAR